MCKKSDSLFFIIQYQGTGGCIDPPAQYAIGLDEVMAHVPSRDKIWLVSVQFPSGPKFVINSCDIRAFLHCKEAVVTIEVKDTGRVIVLKQFDGVVEVQVSFLKDDPRDKDPSPMQMTVYSRTISYST